MKKIINTYCRLSLVVHELSHLIIGCFLLNKLDYMYVKVDRKSNLVGIVVWKTNFRNIFEIILVNLSPLFFMIFFIILAFYFDFFIYVVFYQLTTIKYSLPSKWDIFYIKNYNLCVKFNHNMKLVNDYRMSLGFPTIFSNSDESDRNMEELENELIRLMKE